MDDDERTIEIQRLRKQLSDATTRKIALLEEVNALAARLPERRATFGNPFFYSHPENANESIANYTGSSSHEVSLPTVLALKDTDRELRRIMERLGELGVSGD